MTQCQPTTVWSHSHIDCPSPQLTQCIKLQMISLTLETIMYVISCPWILWNFKLCEILSFIRAVEVSEVKSHIDCPSPQLTHCIKLEMICVTLETIHDMYVTKATIPILWNFELCQSSWTVWCQRIYWLGITSLKLSVGKLQIEFVTLEPCVCSVGQVKPLRGPQI